MSHFTHAAARLTRTIKWHRPYFTLAIINVLVVALGMLFNHQLVESYQRSVNANRAWVEQLASYSSLVSLASSVNAPGNTVFETREFEREEKKLKDAAQTFEETLAKAQFQLQGRFDQSTEYGWEMVQSVQALQRHLSTIDATMNEMVREAERVFTALKEGDPEYALMRMTMMDRRYADVIGTLAVFREHVALIQNDLLTRELSAVEQLRRYQYVLLGFVLILVAAAIAYGRHMVRQMALQANEREGYLIALRESEDKFRRQASLLDKAKDAIVVSDMEQHVMYWNRGAEQMFGWRREEVLGRCAKDFLYHEPELFQHMLDSMTLVGEWSGEHQKWHKEGKLLTVESSWTLVRDDKGNPQSIFSINTDISKRKTAEEQIQRLAFYDQLTGLPNRQLLQDRLQQAVLACTRNQCQGAVMFIDLDNFKTLNDSYGHDKGDLLLQQVALRLTGSIRQTDTVARWGGDEFVVLLEGLDSDIRMAASQAEAVGEKLLATLKRPYDLSGYQYLSTSSIGVALFNAQDRSSHELLKHADLAMYRAKAAGRNVIRFFDPTMQTAISSQMGLEADFRASMEGEAFSLVYQPQVTRDGRVTGVEALIRWLHPQRDQVPPYEFIPLAEETGLIVQLGRWVLEAACAQLAAWSRDPLTAGLTMSVNISAREFRHNDFVANVIEILKQSGANPSLLKLELTESVLLEDTQDAVEKMMALQAHGLTFSLDDFGTGYSSLSYLKRLPLHQLKIDRSFVNDVPNDPQDVAISQAIIALGQNLGLSVIAEGVETQEQLRFLNENGCDAYQGFLLSKPIKADDLHAFMTAWLASKGLGERKFHEAGAWCSISPSAPA